MDSNTVIMQLVSLLREVFNFIRVDTEIEDWEDRLDLIIAAYDAIGDPKVDSTDPDLN